MNFEPTTMKALVEQDRYLSFVFKDLVKKNGNEEQMLEVVFNSNVLGDSVFEQKYQELKVS